MKEFTSDIKNLFGDLTKEVDGEIVKLIADGQYHTLSRYDCKNLLSMTCIIDNVERRLKMIKCCIEHDCYVDLALAELSQIVTGAENSMQLLKNENIVADILQYATEIKLSHDECLRLIDILEILYARGMRLTDKMLYFYRSLTSDIISMQADMEVIRSQLALLAYGADKYTADANLERMAGIYSMAKQNRLKQAKGMIYYYHYIFYSRTNSNELYIPMKNGYQYHRLDEACLAKAKKYGYWLTQYIL